MGPDRFIVFDTRMLRRIFGPKEEDIMRRWRNSGKMIQVDHTGDMRSVCKIMFSKSKVMIYA